MKPLRLLVETSLRTKIALVFAVPVAALCCIEGSLVLDNLADRSRAAAFSALVEVRERCSEPRSGALRECGGRCALGERGEREVGRGALLRQHVGEPVVVLC